MTLCAIATAMADSSSLQAYPLSAVVWMTSIMRTIHGFLTSCCFHQQNQMDEQGIAACTRALLPSGSVHVRLEGLKEICPMSVC